MSGLRGCTHELSREKGIRMMHDAMSHHQWISVGPLRGTGSVHSDCVSESFSPMAAESQLL
jgi:hypothetical protein